MLSNFMNFNRTMNSGDWTCAACNEVNFRKRDQCRKCHKGKYVKKEGDWECSCGEINFVSRINCRKCNKENPNKDNAKQHHCTVPIKIGDWVCANNNCNEHNFSYRDICRKCNKPKTTTLNDKFEDKTCVICMTDSQTHAIIKCGHLCYCGVCGFVLDKCPVCRINYNPDTDLLKIFDV